MSKCYLTGLIYISLALLASQCLAADAVQPPKIGNFSVPNSQQPGPLVGFGENIIDKKETILLGFADDLTGTHEHQVDVIPSVLYGINDNLSLFVNFPVAASYRMGSQRSHGLEDFFAQLEYAFYNKSTKTYVDQATFVANVTVPTGSIHKYPSTGVGSPSFFLGATYNRTCIDWFFFGGPGAVLTTTNRGRKFGNNYFYQLGIGREIAVINGWLFAWMAEMDGTYSERNRSSGMLDHNSGGNVITATPSLWISTKYLIFQFGAGYPVAQHLFGNQPRNSYSLVLNLGWSFY